MSTALLAIAAALAAALAAGGSLGPRARAHLELARMLLAEKTPWGLAPALASATAAAGLVVVTLGPWALAVVALPMAVVGVAGPRMIAARRRCVLGAQLGAAAEAIGASCEAGRSFPAAVASAADELPTPISDELARVRETLALGGRVDAAMGDLAERIDSADARLFAAVVSVQRRSGGDLGPSLRRLGRRMERRRRLTRELRSATAQARSTAAIVAVLPLVAAGLAEVASPGAITGLLSTPAGAAVLVASSVLQALGLILVHLVSKVTT